MTRHWVCIYSTVFAHLAEMAVQILQDNGIVGVIINKKDSSYNSFGEIEVHVNRNDVIRAKQILKDLEE